MDGGTPGGTKGQTWPVWWLEDRPRSLTFRAGTPVTAFDFRSLDESYGPGDRVGNVMSKPAHIEHEHAGPDGRLG